MASQTLDLSALPPIFVLSAHLDEKDRHDIEDRLVDADAPLTYDIREARIVAGNINTKKSAALQLRLQKLWTDEAVSLKEQEKRPSEDIGSEEAQPVKRQKTNGRFTAEQTKNAIVIDDEDGSNTESEPEDGPAERSAQTLSRNPTPEERLDAETEPSWSLPSIGERPNEVVFVVKIAWVEDCFKDRTLLPIEKYLVYAAVAKARQPTTPAPRLHDTPIGSASRPQSGTADSSKLKSSIKLGAQADRPPSESRQPHKAILTPGRRRFGDHQHRFAPPKEKAKMLQQTTSDYESGGDDIPEPPEWVKKDIKYACMRRTPTEQANSAFITELKKIRTARELVGDEIGVRAYSTSIAAVAAYPFPFQHPREVLRLPGCDVKIANLWTEWKNSGHIKEAEDDESDEAMTVLREFYNIWGVGAAKAREFYDRGWRDRDDIVEFGWDTLTRVQQIGLKYYDELLQDIPRGEVEAIASTVREHAVRARDSGIEVLVAGGYRRGKQGSGDVDIIISHRQLGKTANLVRDVVASLEQDGWITHTLLLTLAGTHGGQSTLPFRGAGHGHGFDALDKALVVWQDPNHPGRPRPSTPFSSMDPRSPQTGSGSASPKQQDAEAQRALERRRKAAQKANPNPHRRVDIIVSPWRTVGCAVLGWSGGTTFQRDVRRYAKAVKGWKFDSSGVRDRRTGLTVDLEGPEGVMGDGQGMVDAEKRVFEGLGLQWLKPEDRCTH